MKTSTISICILALVAPALFQEASAQTAKRTEVSTKNPGKALNKDRKAINALAKPFFTLVTQGEYVKALEGLKASFAIPEGKRTFLAERMAALEKKLGKPVEYEKLAERRLMGSGRIVVVYYATYHPLKPAIWELVYYRAPASKTTPERWMLTSMRFETEKIFEWLEGVTP